MTPASSRCCRSRARPCPPYARWSAPTPRSRSATSAGAAAWWSTARSSWPGATRVRPAGRGELGHRGDRADLGADPGARPGRACGRQGPRALARFLLVLLQGIRVLGRTEPRPRAPARRGRAGPVRSWTDRTATPDEETAFVRPDNRTIGLDRSVRCVLLGTVQVTLIATHHRHHRRAARDPAGPGRGRPRDLVLVSLRLWPVVRRAAVARRTARGLVRPPKDARRRHGRLRPASARGRLARGRHAAGRRGSARAPARRWRHRPRWRCSASCSRPPPGPGDGGLGGAEQCRRDGGNVCRAW